MGQRLNIEIFENGVSLANAYYHWSAYTSCSLNLLEMLIKHKDEFKGDKPIVRAIKLLETTGARIIAEENMQLKLADEEFAKERELAANRNDGLIAISEGGKTSTRDWQEGVVSIYLDENRIDFNVFWKEKVWEWENERKEDGKEIKRETLPKCEINFKDLKFDKFGEFKKFVEDLISHENYDFISIYEPDYVYHFIE